MSKNNFNKRDIYTNLSIKKGYSILLSRKIINDLVKILFYEVEKNSLYLKNIGSFKILNKKERIGRNPKTKEVYKIKARKSLIFKPSINLLKKINKYNEKIN